MKLLKDMPKFQDQASLDPIRPEKAGIDINFYILTCLNMKVNSISVSISIEGLLTTSTIITISMN